MSSDNRFVKIVKTGLFISGCLYAFNKFVSSRALLTNVLKKGDGKMYTWKYGNVFYRVSGGGDRPVLLVHDADVISSGYEWNELVSKLEESCTVYTVDLPGCGRSDKPGINYTNYFYVLFLRDFIDDVIGEPAEVVTSGFSASFAATAAMNYPELFSKIIMIDPPALEDLQKTVNPASRYLNHVFSLPIFGRAIYYMIVNHKSIEYQLEENYYYNPFKLDNDKFNAAYEAAHYGSGSGRYFWGSMKGGYLNWDIRRALTLLDMPVTVVYGKQSDTARDTAKAYRQLNDGIQLAGVDMARRLPHVERAEETAQIVLS